MFTARERRFTTQLHIEIWTKLKSGILIMYPNKGSKYYDSANEQLI